MYKHTEMYKHDTYPSNLLNSFTYLSNSPSIFIQKYLSANLLDRGDPEDRYAEDILLLTDGLTEW